MLYCKGCGKEIQDSARFCPFCGTLQNPTYNEGKRKQIFDGKIYKCPNCGQILNAFSTVCPSCGYEIRGREATNSIQDLAEKIQQIEAGREHEKRRHGIFKNDNYIGKTDAQEISVIQSFPIPNTIEDILEFMILASSNVDMDTYDIFKNTDISYGKKEISKAWKAKEEQAYEKAKYMFNKAPQFQEVQSIYNSTQLNIKKSKKIGVGKWIALFAWLPLMIIIAVVASSIQEADPNYKINERETQLESTVGQIEDDISYGSFSSARNKAYTLTFDKDLSKEKAVYWEKKQAEILAQIDKAEKASKSGGDSSDVSASNGTSSVSN